MRKDRTLLAIFLGVLLFCKLYYWLFIYPNADEAYYWLWGRNTSLSYHDHPPLQAWVQGLFYTLFGKSLFVLRLPAFLSFILIAYIYYRFLQRMDFKFGEISSIIIVIMSTPLVFLFLSFAWNDYLMITLCLGSSIYWMHYLNDKWIGLKGRNLHIFLAFFLLGLAGLSKYNAVFISLGVVILVVVNKKLHSVLKDPRIYLGVLLCTLIISPIFIWNIQHEFGGLHFNLVDRVIKKTSLDNLFHGNYVGFIFGSITSVSPLIWIGIVGSWRQREKEQVSYAIVYGKLARTVFICTVVTFLIMSFFCLVLYYWALPAYLLIMPLAVRFLIRKRRLLVTLVYAAVLNLGIIVHLGVIPLTSFLDNWDDLDNVHHYGWEEIGSRANDRVRDYSEDVRIFTSSYRTASLLSYELDRTDILSYSSRFDQFDYWTMGVIYKEKSALLLTDDWQKLSDQLIELTENMFILDTIRIEKWGYPIKEYYLYSAEIKDEFRKTPFSDFLHYPR